MGLKGNDFLYLGLGAGALWLILKNTKPLSEGIVEPVSKVVGSASSVVTPLLTAAGKGAAIVTNPESWKPENKIDILSTPAGKALTFPLGGWISEGAYAKELIAAPFTTEQSWRAFKQQPGAATFINAAVTSLGLWR